MEQKAAKVYISGRVQGVWFRAYTRDMAAPMGLNGYVKNLPDGRVEAVFCGPEEMVKQAIEWCHQGSPNSQVSKVEVAWLNRIPEYGPFSISY